MDAGGEEPRRLTVSVLVPTWNEERALPALLASLGPAGGADEVVVGDAGSHDATVRTARALGARVVFSALGRGTQLAVAAQAAAGDILVVLHADARLGVGALDAVRAAFREPGLAAAGLRQRIDHPRAIYRRIERAADARVRRGIVYGDSGLSVRREAYEAAGGFRSVPLFEDLELSRELARIGRIELLETAELTLSARRWQRRGVVRQTLRNRALTLAWRLGVPPERLARHYARNDR
ncbi:MAG: TIGR04283 family arsenosugar biosynthesis glycosyltransferase [Planctomycetota bacterium]